SSGNISQAFGDAFAGLIVKHLGVLKIHHLEIHCAEEFLGSSHRLAYAFAACTAITHLTLDGVGDHRCELLVKSRFRLVSTNLTMSDSDDELGESSSEEDDDSDDDDSTDDPNSHQDPRYSARHNPIVVLRNSRRTPKSLTGTGCKTSARKRRRSRTSTSASRPSRCTRVQCSEVPFVFCLASAFPNLRTLHTSFALDAIMDASKAAAGDSARGAGLTKRAKGVWILTCSARFLGAQRQRIS
ncbi:hypothetical protein V8D89_008568, partial [Ganoderma adspersum]